MSDILEELYHLISERSPSSPSKELINISQELAARLDENGTAVFEDYKTALFRTLEQEDQVRFLRTLALGMELGRLSVS